MARSFVLRSVIKNPPVHNYSVPVQLALPGNNGDTETSYILRQSEFVQNIDRYYAEHEIVVHKSGRANGQSFTSYYEPHRFNFFHDKLRSLIILRTNKYVANSFITALSRDKDWPKIPIDYVKMTPLLPTITGAWFCELKQQYVKSAGFFGNHVNRSQEFKAAAESGYISVLYINIPWYSGEHRVGITSEGSIVTSRHLPNEEEELELITYVYDTFIAPTLVIEKV